ncbi:AraC-like DNA-binding protein [Krasilnikovia cinnamomea]|uniref:AraC-like DNA-binding protein n=1 Tax=Krasilnikovia cinnamomea TaxID=349313 RepID=A0A4Q7ZSW8_9ACTN|nr:AraC family transcriptional regulator [Krasilnikovia cinnamomea]RZU53964.1 AraC-like DNA-binding protein [Krasilnikovia cinnamomea]
MRDEDGRRGERSAGGLASPAHVGRIFTRSPDEHHAWISSRYHDHERRVRVHGRDFSFLAEYCALGELAAVRSSYTAASAETTWQPMAHILAVHLSAGRCRHRWRGGEAWLGERGTMLLPPYGYDHFSDCSDSSGVTLPMEVVLRVAEEATGLDRAAVRFTGLLPVTPTAHRHWLTTADYVRRGIYSLALAPPLLLSAAEQMVAASMLATFPNTTMTTDVRGPRDAATPATVRRAMAFIDARAEHPITLTDIAAAVGVVPRTLQYAFRRHRDITPLGYLRQVRLARAHEQLLAAEPGDGTTVAAVAARWGFARPHRFATAYRQAYDQPPAQTLRS